MSKPECQHILTEVDNAGVVGIFRCVRCGARVAGTREEVADYKIISHPDGRLRGLGPALYSFLFIAIAILFYCSFALQDGKRFIPLAFVLLACIWQTFIAIKSSRRLPWIIALTCDLLFVLLLLQAVL